MMAEQTQEGVSVIMVPFPAQGHLNQLLHFSLLLSSHGFPVHFACSATHNRQARHRLQGWDPKSLNNIIFHDLPHPPFPAPNPDPNAANNFPNHLVPAWDSAIRHLRSPLSSLLSSLSASSRRLVVVHDPLMSFVGYEASLIARTESYRFQCVPAFTQLAFVWEFEGRNGDEQADKELESLLLVPSEDCFTMEFMEFISRQDYDTQAEGVLLNSCRAIEPATIDLLAKNPEFLGKKVFAIGPMNPTTIKRFGEPRDACLEWLDKQPAGSVVYVAFGSTTSMPDEQIEQIGLGLQRSGQRFVLVLRHADKGDIFIDGERRLEESLLLGFEEKVKDVGMVVRGWAPQLDILAHPATAAFMSHCGWNSSMEGLSNGVAILTWPMHSDQPRNALMITEYLKVGVMVREWDRRNEVLPAEAVEAAVKKVMVGDEGESIRKRAKALGKSIREAAMEGGASEKEFKAFMDHIKR